MQSFEILNNTDLSPLIKETMNIGTIGHVSHGKSTSVNAITGKKLLVKNRGWKKYYILFRIFQCEII